MYLPSCNGQVDNEVASKIDWTWFFIQPELRLVHFSLLLD